MRRNDIEAYLYKHHMVSNKIHLLVGLDFNLWFASGRQFVTMTQNSMDLILSVCSGQCFVWPLCCTSDVKNAMIYYSIPYL